MIHKMCNILMHGASCFYGWVLILLLLFIFLYTEREHLIIIKKLTLTLQGDEIKLIFCTTYVLLKKKKINRIAL